MLRGIWTLKYAEWIRTGVAAGGERVFRTPSGASWRRRKITSIGLWSLFGSYSILFRESWFNRALLGHAHTGG